jgi:hypothetical protein
MPVVLGEVDVIKSLLLLRVTNAGEGASGFNVRGGGADQNLILLDEATIFNSSHVFGFSPFLTDAIKDLKLYKRYSTNFGGRVSSVLDIYQRQEQQRIPHEWRHRVNFSRLLLEGPLVKTKVRSDGGQALMVIYF